MYEYKKWGLEFYPSLHFEDLIARMQGQMPKLRHVRACFRRHGRSMLSAILFIRHVETQFTWFPAQLLLHVGPLFLSVYTAIFSAIA